MGIATRYRCPEEATAGCWGDQPKRQYCRACGSRLLVLRGHWGVFTWRRDGRYYPEDAHRTYVRETTAEAWAVATSPDYVVRWLPEIRQL